MKTRLATFIGLKQTMSQTWDSQGTRLPITAVAVNPMVVTQIKEGKDQPTKVQIGVGIKKGRKVAQSLLKHLKKSPKDTIPRHIFEITAGESTPKVGDTIQAASVLSVGDIVSVSGISIGHGFTGVMQRHNFHGGPRTHGQSDRARAPGSIGQGTSPGRVHKGKKMAGHHGSQTKTIRHLQIIHLDTETNQMWINGPIPGSTNQPILIQKTGHQDFVGLYQEKPEVVKDTPKTETPTPEPEAKKNQETPTAPAKPESAPETKPATTQPTSNPDQSDTKTN